MRVLFTARRCSRHGTPMPGFNFNTQAGSSAIERMKDGDSKRHAEFVSRDDDLSSEGNVSRRCANIADAETHLLHMSLGSKRGRSSKQASGCRTLRAQHGVSLFRS